MKDQILEAYAGARSFEEYRAQIRIHAQAFNRVYERLRFVLDVEARNAPLGQSALLILTEDFCIDSVLNVPLIARLVEASPEAELRIASRDRYRTLANQCPGRGGVSRLPTVICMDHEGNVNGYWTERSHRDQRWIEAFLAQDPMPDIVLEDGFPVPELAEWMDRRLAAQLPFLVSTSWCSVRDEVATVARSQRSFSELAGTEGPSCTRF